MPEGDTLHRVARHLGPALTGRTVQRLELPRTTTPTAHLTGTSVESVRALGKNLLVTFSGGWVLHTHLRMSGVWHLHPSGEPWRRARSGAVAILTVDGFQAVCFRAPVVRLLSPLQFRADERLRALGPDLLAPTLDVDVVLDRLRQLAATPIAEALLDQHALAGIGNVYKSEVLFNRRVHPFRVVGSLGDEVLRDLVSHARALMQHNVGRRAPRHTRLGSLAPVSVYGRAGKPCLDCGATVQVRRAGALPRTTYWCPRCQPEDTAP